MKECYISKGHIICKNPQKYDDWLGGFLQHSQKAKNWFGEDEYFLFLSQEDR